MSQKRLKRGSASLDVRESKRAKTSDIVFKSEDSTKISVPVAYDTNGLIFTLGSGDTGQLGLGPDVLEKSRPAIFSSLSLSAAGLTESDSEQFVQVVAGGMHTVCLNSKGEVYTFGCNDEGALGRDADLDPDRKAGSTGDETTPALVRFPEDAFIIMVSAGDSHTAALDKKNRVWIWGTFRGSSGPIGLVKPGEIVKSPVLLEFNLNGQSRSNKYMNCTKIIKIASGQDHLACLSDEGHLFTMGCAEQGQLGRIAQRFCKDGGRYGIGKLIIFNHCLYLESFLQPAVCRIRGSIKFSNVWAGGFATFAKCCMTGVIYVCGLNNYGQLALLKPGISNEEISNEINPTNPTDSEVETELLNRQGPLIQYMLIAAKGIPFSLDCASIAIGIHHTILLDKQGSVYALGRPEYGRLGLGENISMKKSVNCPAKISFENEDFKASWIGAGEACSFAVESATGICYSWGMGNNLQLSQDGEDDIYCPLPMKGKQLLNRRIIMVDAGGQHTVLLGYTSTKTELNVKQDLKTKLREVDNAMDTSDTKENLNLSNGNMNHEGGAAESSDHTQYNGDMPNKSNNLFSCGAPAASCLSHNDAVIDMRHDHANSIQSGLKCMPQHENNSSHLICDHQRDSAEHKFTAPMSSLNKWSNQDSSSGKSSLRQGENNFSSIDIGGESMMAVALPQPMLLSTAGVKRTYSVPSPPASMVGSLPQDMLSTAATIATMSESSSVLDLASSCVEAQAVSNDSSSAASSLCSGISGSMDARSARCTDGGGSSRRSSLGGASAQSSLLLAPGGFMPPHIEDAGGMIVPAPMRHLGPSNRQGNPGYSTSRRGAQYGCASNANASNNNATIMSSICSTSSEPGFPTDTASFGSMTASPYDVTSGEASSL